MTKINEIALVGWLVG